MACRDGVVVVEDGGGVTGVMGGDIRRYVLILGGGRTVAVT